MQKPNILIIMTDHQRADTVLPEHPAVTPNLDRFSQEGVTFTNVYCPSPHCCPSRATFFSGLYPSRHGVWNNVCNRQALSHGLNDGIRLWSEDLADAGYQMHFCGKWHVSVEESPADRGWTEHFVSASAGTHHGVTWEHYRQLAAGPDPAGRGEALILRPGYGTYRLYGTGTDEGTPHDETAVEKALGVLDALRALRADSGPWCLYVGTIAPHDPYDVPQRFLDLYDLDDVPLPASYADELTDKPAIYQRMRDSIFGQLSEREVREGIRHFWAYCSYLDELFGHVLEALERTGRSEDTLVLYCSDHGDYCGDHGLFAKGIPCFRGAYHIPAIIRWPASVRNVGRRVEEFVSLADFAPTFLEAAGLPLEDRYFTGASLVPFLLDERPPEWRDAIYTQCNGVELYYTQRSVTTKDLKYVFNGFDRDELYDLRTDPHEMRNLVNDPAYEDAKRELCRRMWRFAYREDDTAINPYITVGLAPYGPAEAFRQGQGKITGMIIEQASVEDAEEILKLQKLAYRDEAAIYDDYSIPPLTQTLGQIRDDFAGQTFLKATLQGIIVGSVRAFASEGSCYVGRLIVHPDYRNRGIGTQLMHEIEGRFNEVQRYELFTGEKSERNLYLYRKLGYEPFKRQRVTDNLTLIYLEKPPGQNQVCRATET